MKNQSWQAESCWINGKLKLCQGGYALSNSLTPVLTILHYLGLRHLIVHVLSEIDKMAFQC